MARDIGEVPYVQNDSAAFESISAAYRIETLGEASMDAENDSLKSLDPIPTEQALQLLKFKENQIGGYTGRWGRLTVDAGVWLGGWHFMSSWSTGREIGTPEFRVGDPVAPVKLLALLYAHLGSGFCEARLPPEIAIGKAELECRRKIRALVAAPPTVWADREFFRFCLSYLDRDGDWAKEDYRIAFSIIEGQLKIQGRSRSVYCPARGAWLGGNDVSARGLFRVLPKRFSQPVVHLAQHGKGLQIEGRLIPGNWTEEKETDLSDRSG